METIEDGTQIAEKESVGVLDFELEYSNRVNFAFQQNSIPFLFRIVFRNGTENTLKNIKVKIEFTPNFIEPIEFGISLLVPNGEVSQDMTMRKFLPDFNINYLAELSERYSGSIKISLFSESDELLLSKNFPLSLFPRDEWIGANVMPELLASFITPNVSAVAAILRRSGEILAQTTGNSALDSYQSRNMHRVHAILSAIFDAIKELGIIYSNSPASFGSDGQRIRLLDTMMKEKLGTCLDTTLLFCAVMEQSGLRPLIMMNKGHSYVGCWMIEDSFQEPVISDFQRIRKLRDLNEIFLFETTTSTFGTSCTLNDSEKVVLEKLAEYERDFICAIDVNRSRISGIRPLPIERGVIEAKATAPKINISTEGHDFKEQIKVSDSEGVKRTKIEYWKQQLLDLSKRNKFLNFKDTRKSIRIAAPRIDNLEDMFADKTSFRVAPKSEQLDGSGVRVLSLYDIEEYIEREMKEKRLRTYLTENELKNRMTELYRDAKRELDDSGANTLYLTLGILEWRDQSDITYRAPLLLLPVKIERKSLVDGFRLSKFDDDTIINVTLLEMLRHDFAKEICGLDPLPTDEKGVDVGRIFQLLRQEVKDIQGWELKDEVWLAQFTFNKFVLWKDLNSHFDEISKNPIVKSIYDRCATDEIANEKFVDEKSLDKEVGFSNLYCPLSYDSSQLSSIISAQNGRSFVLYGPPGTGKSQTIANLIANSLSNGKRVLFVAEKRVALEVVFNRLNKMGLGKFCLELHSNKSGKSEVLSQFKSVVNLTNEQRDNTWETLAGSLERLRRSLNAYVGSLHKRYPNRLSAYSCYSYLIKNSEQSRNGALELFEKFDILNQGIEELDLMRDMCRKLGASMSGLSKSEIMDMRFIGNSIWTPEWESKLSRTAKELHAVTETFEAALSDALKYFEVPPSTITDDFVRVFMEYMNLLLNAPTLPVDFVAGTDWADFEREARKLVEAGFNRNSSRDKLGAFDIGKLCDIDFSILEEYVHKNRGSFLGRIKNWFKLGVVRKARKNPDAKWNSSEFDTISSAARMYKTSQERVESLSESACRKLGGLWNGGELDWHYFSQLLDYGSLLRKDCRILAGEDLDGYSKIRSKLDKLLASANELLGNDCVLSGKIKSLVKKYSDLQTARSEFASLLKIRKEYLPSNKDIFERIETLLSSLERNKQMLSKWSILQSVYDKAEELKLQPVLNAVYKGKLDAENVCEIFEAKYRKAFVNDLIKQVPELRNFDSNIFESEIGDFGRIDSKYQELTKDIIRARP